MITWRLLYAGRDDVAEGPLHPSFLDIPPDAVMVVAVVDGKDAAGIRMTAEYPIPVFFRSMGLVLGGEQECDWAIVGRANRDDGEFWKVTPDRRVMPAPACDLDAVMIGLQSVR